MKEVYKQCKRCVMDTSVPEIKFDSEGVCSICNEAEKLLLANWFPNNQGRINLEKISNEIREYGKNKEYDCIIGMSGGVDSSYLLHFAVVEMKLRPLVVHVDAGWNSEIAVKNIEQLVKKLGLDLITYVIDWEEIKDLQLSFLKASIANQDVPQDYAFITYLNRIAIKKNIKYVLNGSNLSSESILPISWEHTASDSRQLKGIHREFGTVKLKTYPLMNFFTYRIYWTYFKKIVKVKPLNFIDYDKQKAINFLETNYGWRYYGGKHHESKWTKFHQTYLLPTKFGIDKRQAHLSSLIIANQISREEAINELLKPQYDINDINEDKSYIAKKLGLSKEEFEKIINLPNKTYLDYPNEDNLVNLFNKLKSILRKIK